MMNKYYIRKSIYPGKIIIIKSEEEILIIMGRTSILYSEVFYYTKRSTFRGYEFGPYYSHEIPYPHGK